MRIIVVSILVLAFVKSSTPESSQDYHDETYISSSESASSTEELPPQGRILGGLLKGWKGDDDGHPLTEFGKIHIIKKGGGWGGGGRGGLHDQGQGWGWGQYGPGWTTTYHVTPGWNKPHHKKKSWLKFPKKSFGIHVKGGVGFSFGGKKGVNKGQTVVVQHSPNGWGWNSGHGHQNNYGWGGWGGWANDGDFYGGDYYDDDSKKEDVADDEGDADENVTAEDRDADDEDRRRMDLKDYLYDY